MKTVVGVLRGGPSPEYEVSLKTGASFLAALDEERYHPHDLFIARDGAWHRNGRPMDPLRALTGVDVVINGLHGTYGEDGTVQRFLERSGIPYTGSRASGAALSMHKNRAKVVLREQGIAVPRGLFFALPNDCNAAAMADQVFATFAPPYIIKPAFGGSSVGLTLAKTFMELAHAIADALEAHESVLVEEFIVGQEATVGVVEDFRGQDLYALPPVEIILANDSLFDYDAKYSGATRELCPSTFSHDLKTRLEDAARTAHESLGLAHYSRSDFRIGRNGKVYFLEANALPGMTAESLIPKALNAIGTSLPQFVDHLVVTAQRGF